MSVRYEDLPAALRRKVDAAEGQTLEQSRARHPTNRLPGKLTWTCHQCGEILTSWAAAERHADNTGHPRIELNL